MERKEIEMSASAEMPRYVCHKQVWALQIKEVVQLQDAGAALMFANGETYAPIQVSQDWVDKHNPQPGGYYVVYRDGYKSFSPKQAFEEGYTRE